MCLTGGDRAADTARPRGACWFLWDNLAGHQRALLEACAQACLEAKKSHSRERLSKQVAQMHKEGRDWGTGEVSPIHRDSSKEGAGWDRSPFSLSACKLFGSGVFRAMGR